LTPWFGLGWEAPGVGRAERLGLGFSPGAGSEIILQERWKSTGHEPRRARLGFIVFRPPVVSTTPEARLGDNP